MGANQSDLGPAPRAPITAEGGSADFVEPSVGLCLANLAAAIRSRIEHIKALPDDVFDELTE